MLLFKDFSIAGISVTSQGVSSLLKEELTKAKIKCELINVGNEIHCTFGDKKHPESLVENKVMLRKDSPRIKDLGREYLISFRLTRKQHEAFEKIVTNYLQSIGLSYTMTYQEFADDPLSRITVVDNGVVVGKLVQPKDFPIEMGA